MKIDQVLETYDAAYAAHYDEAFLTNSDFPGKTKAEIDIIRHLLAKQGPTARWLDVACGTGFYLSHFPEARRSGLDISPAMLGVARQRNPGVDFVLGNYRDRDSLPIGQQDVISSLWWAYTFAESLDQIQTLIDNIHAWLADDGVCFMPICSPSRNLYFDPEKAPYVAFEDAPVYGGRMLVTAVTWSWIEASGKRHDNMLVPQPEYLVEMFRRQFPTVEIVEYSAGWHRAILASKTPRQFDDIKALFPPQEPLAASVPTPGIFARIKDRFRGR
jgi:SAM-dependent methyltransferase